MSIYFVLYLYDRGSFDRCFKLCSPHPHPAKVSTCYLSMIKHIDTDCRQLSEFPSLLPCARSAFERMYTYAYVSFVEVILSFLFFLCVFVCSYYFCMTLYESECKPVVIILHRSYISIVAFFFLNKVLRYH